MLRLLLTVLLWSVCAATAADAPAPTRLELLLARGRAATARGQSFEAEGAFRDAIQANPRDLRGYIALTNCYLAVAEPAHALEVLAVAERLAPDASVLVRLRAQAFVAQARTADARALLRTFNRRHPEDLEALQALAELLEGTGQLTEALACYRRLVHASKADDSTRDNARLHSLALAQMLGPVERVAPVKP